MNTKVKAIIIDDEFHNQVLLKELINEYAKNFEILGCFSNIKEGSAFINKNDIDVVFLDIEMPEQMGLELFSLCSANDFITIVVSAHDQYAIPAIKEGVFDYILKPIDIVELKKALQKVSEHLLDNNKQEHIKLLINSKITLIKLDDIMLLEAEGSYTKFTLKNGQTHLQSKHLAYFSDILKDAKFIRVHRSSIVNSSLIQSIDKSSYELRLNENVVVKYSPRRWKSFKEFLE